MVLFGLALLPLGWAFLREDDAPERMRRTVERNPEVVEHLWKALPIEQQVIDRMSVGAPATGTPRTAPPSVSRETILMLLPDRRIEGAHLSLGSSGHFLYGGISALLFLAVLYLAFPHGNSSRWTPLAILFLVGTAGIALLLLFQALAGMRILSRNPLVWILLVIGESYRAASDPNTSFLVSLLGYAFGVGLCEELCKVLPLYWHYHRGGDVDRRGALLWGLAAGIGFGVTEGLFYSADFYNGTHPAGVYAVRFVSCVALHAVWSGGVAVMAWWDQDAIYRVENVWEFLATLPGILGAGMLLHALYDALLKRGWEMPAFATACASLAWLAWLVRRSAVREMERGTEAAWR